MKKLIGAVVAVAVLAGAGLVFAQSANAPAGEPYACQSDVKKLCPKVTLGGLDMYKCVKSGTDALSFQCKEWVKNFDIKVGEAKVSCVADRDKYCKDVVPGNGAIAKCLRGHMMTLSRKCAAHLPSNAEFYID